MLLMDDVCAAGPDSPVTVTDRVSCLRIREAYVVALLRGRHAFRKRLPRVHLTARTTLAPMIHRPGGTVGEYVPVTRAKRVAGKEYSLCVGDIDKQADAFVSFDRLSWTHSTRRIASSAPLPIQANSDR